MTGLFAQPPRNLCLLRLSAVGDVTHVLPVVNTIKAQLPQTKITWIIGSAAHSLVNHLAGVEFIVLDKARGAGAYAALRRALRGRRFDALLLMQYSLRAHLASLLVRAPVRLGFDRARSKDLHGLFINHRIAARPEQHVLDGFFCFTEALGIEQKVLRWDRCHGENEARFAERHLPGTQKTLLISPCSSHPLRNWPAQRYAAVADHAVLQHGMRVALSGGGTDIERRYRDEIRRCAAQKMLDLVGRTDLKQLAALIARADIVLAPDSGPMHLASCVGTPAVSLFAATNPDRAAPFPYRRWCVNRYPDTVREHFGKEVGDIPWGTKIEKPGVMENIRVEEVNAMLARLLAATDE